MDLSRAVWQKSSLSTDEGECVEVAFVEDAVAVRDSKDRSGPALVFTPGEWRAFVGGVKADEFNRQ